MSSRKVLVGLAIVELSLALGAAARADVMTGMNAYWKLDEISGSSAPDSVGSYDATLQGDATWVADVQRGQVLTVDGVQDAALWTAPPISRPISVTAGTTMAWVKLATEATDPARLYMAFPGQSYAGGSRVYMYSYDNEFCVGLGSQGDLSLTNSFANAFFDDYNWHQIALTWDDGETIDGSGDFAAYFDGAPVISGTYGGLTVPTPWVSIGSNFDTGDSPPISSEWQGQVSEAGTWSRALSEMEVAAIHAAGQINSESPNLSAYWKLNETSGTVAHDTVGGFHATLQGDATWVADAQRGQVLSVDGTQDNAVYLEPPPLAPAVDPAVGTVLGWVKLDAGADDTTRIVFPGISGLDGNRIYVYSANGAFCVGLGSTGNLGSTGKTFDAQWHQVALSWDDGETVDGSGDYVAYFDGAPVLSGAYDGLTTQFDWFSMGSNCDPRDVPPLSSEWKGQVDEVGLWGRVLSAQEVAAIYAAGDIDSVPTLLPGDANDDHVVDDKDASILGAHWLQSGAEWGDGDFNNDHVVNDKDAAILAAHWGAGAEDASTPEPSTLGLLIAGMIATFALRRRVR